MPQQPGFWDWLGVTYDVCQLPVGGPTTDRGPEVLGRGLADRERESKEPERERKNIEKTKGKIGLFLKGRGYPF